MTSRLNLFVPAKASSHRQKKVAEEIRHRLSDTLSRGDLPTVRDPKTHEFLSFSLPITITHVDVSPDLKHATLYIMPLGGKHQAEALYFMERQKGYLRKFLSSHLRLRCIPELHISLDQSFDYADHVHTLLNETKCVDDSI
jgi:ribosome-binding factor A